jgi:hypothetical protein
MRITLSANDTLYMENNCYHRECGPAVDKQWEKRWYQRGSLHRLDGPAVIRGEYKMYYFYGCQYQDGAERVAAYCRDRFAHLHVLKSVAGATGYPLISMIESYLART